MFSPRMISNIAMKMLRLLKKISERISGDVADVVVGN